MTRPYGFGIKLEDSAYECLFTAREWGIINDGSPFNTIAGLTRLIGMDAIGPDIGVKKYETIVTRANGYFVGQLEGLLRGAEPDDDVMCHNYQTYIKGSGSHPINDTSCSFLGQRATVWGGPAHCSLRWYGQANGRLRDRGFVDLRREKYFEVDGGQVIAIRRTKKPWEGFQALRELIEFCSSYANDTTLAVRLIGGDS